MSTVSVGDAETRLSRLVDDAIQGEVVTITRSGKPVAALVSIEAAEIARKVLGPSRPGLVAYLRTFPGGEVERDRSPSRDADL